MNGVKYQKNSQNIAKKIFRGFNIFIFNDNISFTAIRKYPMIPRKELQGLVQKKI